MQAVTIDYEIDRKPAGPASMQAVVFRAHGGLEQIQIDTVAVPMLGPDDVLVRVRAVALNGFDPMVLRGIPGLPTPLPMIPCADCAGDIVAVGAKVDRQRWRPGQRVTVIPIRPGEGMMGETLPGVAAEYCVVPQAALLSLPDAVSYIQAACLPTAYGTAFRMMTTRARVMRGERVLILGASGGVGTCCVQLARLAGAEVIACAGSDEALRKLQALGAHHTISSERNDHAAEVVRRFGKPSIWGGGGVDVVVDFLGGHGWSQSLACLGRGGRLVTCGASAGYDVATDLRYVWSFEIEILGSNGWSADDQATLLRMVADRSLTPVVHAVRPLGAYVEAMRELMDQRVFGKSVLEP